jgi:hypothetical protein
VSAAKQRLSERPPAQRLFIWALLVVSVGLVTAAERDIQRRPVNQVRGRKLPWRALSLNALGALAYFCWGRRAPAGQADAS